LAQTINLLEPLMPPSLPNALYTEISDRQLPLPVERLRIPPCITKIGDEEHFDINVRPIKFFFADHYAIICYSVPLQNPGSASTYAIIATPQQIAIPRWHQHPTRPTQYR
jgi:hypothetical protein